MTSATEDAAIEHVRQRLSSQFPAVDTALVARVVRDTHRRFNAHPTREFVPILVEDAAWDVLRVLPPAVHAVTDDVGRPEPGDRGRQTSSQERWWPW